MALATFKCNQLTPLHFKGLNNRKIEFWFVTESGWREDDWNQSATFDGDAEDRNGAKRSSVSWLLATTLRRCKTNPTSCFGRRVGRFSASKRPERLPESAPETGVGLQQKHLILSSLYPNDNVDE